MNQRLRMYKAFLQQQKKQPIEVPSPDSSLDSEERRIARVNKWRKRIKEETEAKGQAKQENNIEMEEEERKEDQEEIQNQDSENEMQSQHEDQDENQNENENEEERESESKSQNEVIEIKSDNDNEEEQEEEEEDGQEEDEDEEDEQNEDEGDDDDEQEEQQQQDDVQVKSQNSNPLAPNKVQQVSSQYYSSSSQSQKPSYSPRPGSNDHYVKHGKIIKVCDITLTRGQFFVQVAFGGRIVKVIASDKEIRKQNISAMLDYYQKKNGHYGPPRQLCKEEQIDSIREEIRQAMQEQ